MAASYPTSVKSFGSAVVDGVTDVLAAHVNDLREEVVALETDLLVAGTYSPTWTTGGTAPTLSNGTLTGYYSRYAKKITYKVTLTWGSSTNGGTGAWSFSLPYAAASTGGAVGPVYILDSGTQIYVGIARISNSGSTVAVYGPTTNITASSPQTWAVNDIMELTITYWTA